MKVIEKSLQDLVDYIEKEKYQGFDPYDGLRSPYFDLPLFRSNKTIRFCFQQVIKRSPINLRRLFLIPKGLNPVTLGLCIQGYSMLTKAFPEKQTEYKIKVDALINELEKLIPKGYSGACWGYDFDWAARYSNIPAYQPTIVATGIITNSLFIAYEVFENKKALDLCKSACEFILKDINRTFDEEKNFCFSYSPFDHQEVFNASMKGVRLLAQVYSVTKNEILKTEAKKATAFLIKYQRNDGAWVYSRSKTGIWVDNYHTGYILDCLDEFIKRTGDDTYKENLKKGCAYYFDHFFENNGMPRFYDNKTYPVDCTAASQSLLTLTRFNNTEQAAKTATWMIDNMQNEEGYFYFRKFKNYTVKQSFMRWSNAWMFAGIATLICKIKNAN
ncbi:MAG: delta-aminolevulinic acid dehydratase [Bacteroidetes bacterium]|nr:delta-aminolevulinic acid dehydratase [Bacteroidota bacterium]